MLSMIGYLLFFAGLIICFIYGCILIIQAFNESILWGLLYLFVPFGNLVYIVKFWDEAKRPFLMALLGVGIMVVGMVLSPELMNSLES